MHDVAARAASAARAVTAKRETLQFTLLDRRGKLESLESKKAALASPQIDVFQRERFKELDEVQKRVSSEERDGAPDNFSLRPSTIFLSNKTAVEHVVTSIRAAIKEADALRNLILTDEEIAKGWSD